MKINKENMTYHFTGKNLSLYFITHKYPLFVFYDKS